MATHTDIFNLIPGYALGCLDDDELILVSEHLADCVECQTELQSYGSIIDRLALAAPETLPSPALHRRLMQQIQVPPSQHIPQESSRNLWGWITPFWAGAGLLIILILTASNLFLWWQLNQPAQPDMLNSIMLTGTQVAPDATGVIILRSYGEYGTLVVDHLPPLDTDYQYQLWLIDDDQRTSGGVFSVSDNGCSSVEILTSEPLDSYSAFGISIEPAGGSPGPTGQKVLGSTLN
jgi:anti-sigma-K factor RskA